ncbi:Uncharacterized protein TCAP_01550 [Tolypocladium capitatum]|uniref:Xylanolytic transcriptional activator regulatory domain-containing protein n=1 Tax=Tolypocladium capitatum TaxID=45235 RepID=A0A2K3QLX2_9HYPO|nr:Uncharacterized protein TCAP_01550 [Tolypocladium capitatum]
MLKPVSVQCSGERPACHRCSTRKMPCEYDAEPNQSRAESRREVDEQLRELYTCLQTRPWDEALEILRRVREMHDPLAVLRFVRDGDLLLHAKFVSALDTFDDGAPDASAHQRGDRNVRDPSGRAERGPSAWTAVADKDTVAELIGICFERDQSFLMPFIDRGVFLADMQAHAERPQAGQFCSMLLVNAICAISSCHSRSAPGPNPAGGRQLGEAFFNEAKRLLDLECGRPSIPSAQALFIMFSYSCRVGRDRAGHIFRAAGYEMMKRMMPKIRRLLSGTANLPDRHRRAISRAVWGIFCFDSVCSSVYLRPPLFPVPDVPRAFSLLIEAGCRQNELESALAPAGGGDDVEEEPKQEQEHEELEEEFGDDSDDMALSCTCDLSEILNEVLAPTSGCVDPRWPKDGGERLVGLYAELQKQESKMPPEDSYWGKRPRQHSYLWAYHHLVAVNIARLLEQWDGQIVSSFSKARDIAVRHCESMMEHLDNHLNRYPSERRGCLTTLYFAHSCSFALIDLVGTSPSAARSFSRACRVFHEATEELPLSNLLLQGLAAVAEQCGVQLPDEVLPYIRNLGKTQQTIKDVPLGFVVPIRGGLAGLLSDEAWDSDPEVAGVELGGIIARYNASLI